MFRLRFQMTRDDLKLGPANLLSVRFNDFVRRNKLADIKEIIEPPTTHAGLMGQVCNQRRIGVMYHRDVFGEFKEVQGRTASKLNRFGFQAVQLSNGHSCLLGLLAARLAGAGQNSSAKPT